MAFDMVDTNQRNPECVSHRFGIGHTDKQRANEPGASGDSNPFDLGQFNASLLQRLFDNNRTGLKVFTGREFRHHTTVTGMEINLRGNNIA